MDIKSITKITPLKNGQLLLQWFYPTLENLDPSVPGKNYRKDGPAMVLTYSKEKGGKKESEIWYTSGSGKINRDDGRNPAITMYSPSGEKEGEHWVKEGEYVRDNNKPTSICYNEDGNGSRTEKWTDKTGKNYHRIGSPAVITYDKDENKIEDRWYYHGKNTRRDSPNHIKYFKNGDVAHLQYLVNDVPHKIGGDEPASIQFYTPEEGGTKKYEVWFKNGNMFRENDLPNFIKYFPTGKIHTNIWYDKYPIVKKIEHFNKN